MRASRTDTRSIPTFLRDYIGPAPREIAGFQRLHELTVGPFRGFTRPEVFDLSRDITLVYGANGTGKSSFCEALEAAMLGSISEAEAKRIDFRAYCDNVRLRRHALPQLLAAGFDGNVRPVSPSEDAYRFCFIEKNRLEDFGRIAARTPAGQRQLIATLFGLDQFGEFVRGFNLSLDDDLNLTGHRAAELARRRNVLAAAEQTVRAYPAILADADAAETALANRVQPNVPFQAVCDWLLGTGQESGRLQAVQAQLIAVPPPIYGWTRAGLVEQRGQAYAAFERYRATQAELAGRVSDLSFSRLYEALVNLADGATACPACGTDLQHVAQNPFERAREGLGQLQELGDLQRQLIAHQQAMEEALRQLLAGMQGVVRASAFVCPDRLHAARLPVLPGVSAGAWLDPWVANADQAWHALLALVDQIEASDAQAMTMQAQRDALAREQATLDGIRIEIERLRAVRDRNQQAVEQARAAIAQFEQANQRLIEEVAAEAAVVRQHQVIRAAYDEYINVLRQYLAQLPSTLLAGLGDMARDLYNAFNRDDVATDRLHLLRLPLAENGKIEIAFAGAPAQRFDALMILSEGHIKCLGLAILLAKNISQGCPVVVFDDVVNAIDDDHRNGIWRTFFEDHWLTGKQVILTSHAEEFLQRIQQELGAARVGGIKRFKFLPHLGEHELRVDADPPMKNYVLAAQNALADDDKRDALRQARPAIESLTDRLWRWMDRRGLGAIDLTLTGPRAKWELNNKCVRIRAALRRIDNASAGIQQALAALDALLGVQGGAIEWRYLNAGTHDAEQDHEFDRATVQTIVGAVTALDAGLAALA